MKTYPLLEKAPQDHNSDEFLQFLRDNNVVVSENEYWLIVENCKYHTKENPHYTAFFVPINLMSPIRHLNKIDCDFDSWQWLKKRESDQTVKRYHIHLIK